MSGMESGNSVRKAQGVQRETFFGISLPAFYVVILALYPLRHIHWGLDLWDTGYNYANFQYMGLEHMDPMWLFSTYLANAAGNLLSRLPMADSLAGMNFYTGLFVSVLALLGYFFCTRRLRIPSWIAFIGEFAAISLCWCPTALLYNYLTYVLFLGCVMLLYTGLVREKKWCLFFAGVCLGCNVLVRFSNLPQAAMIVAVWAYGVVEAFGEEGKNTGTFVRRTVRRTAWCLFGYLAAGIVLLGYLQIRYGLDAYFEGIQRLFAMTDDATDYKAVSMVRDLIFTYVENLYWVFRIGVIAAGGLLLFGTVRMLSGRLSFFKKHNRITAGMKAAVRGLWILVCGAMLVWLYARGFCSTEYYSYGAILRPGVLFLMLTMFIGVIRIFSPKCGKEEKLISGMLILVILLTSIGSNNGVYPSMNNLFVAAPYTLWESWRFCRRIGGKQDLFFPIKGVLAAFLLLFLVQSSLFGASFVFVEATGAQDVTETVDNNEVLKGIKMSPERAEWMESVSAYVEENALKEREVILYGSLPALSYYLQMPSAFNPWCDLRSYSAETMERDLQETGEKLKESGERPVIIVEQTFMTYLEGGEDALEKSGMEDKRILEIQQDEKWKMLCEFMEEYGYEKTFSNGKFTLWE